MVRRLHASSDCVCGLQPCLTPHCVAFDFTTYGGNLVADDRSLAPYQGTPEEVAGAMLTLAELQPGETFCDLGCGDGRVLLHALQHFGAGAVLGWELDPAVHRLAQAHMAARRAAVARGATTAPKCSVCIAAGVSLRAKEEDGA